MEGANSREIYYLRPFFLFLAPLLFRNSKHNGSTPLGRILFALVPDKNYKLLKFFYNISDAILIASAILCLIS